jgi:poly(3-hydroxybutyrate) depolymerase
LLYYLHEAQRLAMAPARMMASLARLGMGSPMNPWAFTNLGRQFNSFADVFEHVTRRYGKPEWDLDTTTIDGVEVPVSAETVISRAYCHLVHFQRDIERDDPKLLIVAPLSGHYATLLRGTVEAMLPDHEVYITDWMDCKMVPVMSDRFNLDDYIDYVIDFLHYLGPNTHVLAVCQPSVPVLAAVSVMSGWGDVCTPSTMTLIGGPIDTRRNPTAVNKLAEANSIEWFESNVVATVPPPYPGMMRKVYPGFIQLTNFISMNFDRHMASLSELFDHLVEGDEEAADRKRAFYEEYLAVMDLPAEFYLQTVETVFQKHSLPKGEMITRWHPVLPEMIERTAIMCVEGELDDISGVGQTKAALDLTPNLSSDKKAYHLEKGAGHYGVFNGGKWRRAIAPAIKKFIRTHDHKIGDARDRIYAAAYKRRAAAEDGKARVSAAGRKKR